jgi:hypothetical protein
VLSAGGHPDGTVGRYRSGQVMPPIVSRIRKEYAGYQRTSRQRIIKERMLLGIAEPQMERMRLPNMSGDIEAGIALCAHVTLPLPVPSAVISQGPSMHAEATLGSKSQVMDCVCAHLASRIR